MHSKFLSIAIASLFLVSAAVSAQQSASSGFAGQVTDSSQGGVPGATVTVTNVGTNAQRTAVTDGEGRFSIPALPPATYPIKVELQGFQTAELQNFVLRQGETARPTITLGVATVSESVTVTGEAPLLQTQSASVGQVISEKQIEDLPLNGRTVLSLASLSAGVTPRNFARNTQFGRRNQFITVEGGRDSSTNYTIDGVYVRSLRFNNLSLNPPIDAVQEVSLLRNSFSTEYGQGQAVVSIVTKSGTNQMHGSAYEFYRGDRFDAKNFFAPTKPEYKRNQFGGTGGGPLMRNKFFVFGAYEGLRTIQGQPFLGSVPSQAFLSGNFSSLATPIRDPLTGQPFPGNIIPTNRFSNFARILTPTIPAPNSAGANNYTVIRNFVDDANTATVRADQTLNNSHSLFQRFMYYKGSQLQPADVHVNRSAAAGAEPRSRAHVGAVDLLGQRISLRIQLRVPLERADQPGRAQLDERSGPAQSRCGDVSARVRTPEPGPSRASQARVKAATRRARRKTSTACRTPPAGRSAATRSGSDCRRSSASSSTSRTTRRAATSRSTATSRAMPSPIICSATVRPAPARSAPPGQPTTRRPSRRSSTTTGR